MDDKGFIFTLDVSLALIVVVVLTASIMVYTLLPAYQGEDHQHLEALADSALEVMAQNGELRAISAKYASGNATLIAQADAELNSTLNSLIPQGIGYRITVGKGTGVRSVENSTGTRNLLTRNDVVTKVKVISAPQEGWMGRAYYKLEHVEFTDQNDTAVTTLWNFHNWLQNYKDAAGPWGNQLNVYRYWGGTTSSSQTPVPIAFNVPSSGTINWAKVLIGASDTGHNENRNTVYNAYNVTFVLNSIKNVINSSNFVSLYNGNGRYMFNYLGTYPGTKLKNGNNTFYLNYSAYSSQNMPWFGLIGSYMNTYEVPQGVIMDTANSTDISGVGNPNNAIIYNLNTGTLQTTAGRSITFSNYLGHDYDVSKPFTLTNVPKIGNNGASGTGAAVATTMDVNYPDNTYLYDSFVVVNTYGGVDGALIEVKDASGKWNTVFDSYDTVYSSRSGTDGGYGNIPGIVNIKDYLRAGHNTVRVTVWDDANGQDYDLVGLINCYSKITYSGLPIRWDCIPFDSYQYNYGTASQSKSFTVDNETDNQAEEALLFVGTGIDTRNITVKLSNGTYTKTIYAGSVPYYLDLGDLDRKATPYILTDVDADGNLTIKSGTYTLTLAITPGLAYESGDGGSSPPTYGSYANPEIFSGTRIDIIYPKFLTNIWSNSYANNANDAKNLAKQALIRNLTGYTVDQNSIKTEALWTGDMPTSTPVRLDLWKE